MLQLPQAHFLRLPDPLPTSLLAAAAVALMPDPRAQQVHGLMQRSMRRSEPSPTAAAAEPTPGLGTSMAQIPDVPQENTTPPSLSAELRSLIIGSPREQLHALRAVLNSLRAKLDELGGARSALPGSPTVDDLSSPCQRRFCCVPYADPPPDGQLHVTVGARMALQYVEELRTILRAAQRQLLQRVTDLLQLASKHVASRTSHDEARFASPLGHRQGDESADQLSGRAGRARQGV